MNQTEDEPERISPRELKEVIARARAEKWQELALIGPLIRYTSTRPHVFHLSEPAVVVATDLATLIDLTSLDLSGNGIGDKGAQLLASLPNLTRLTLFNEDIGTEGACALAGLSKLTQLQLWGNSIGADGVRFLATLTNLTSLQLGTNGIGDEGARALSGLTNLTWLDLESNSIGDEGARALSGLINLTGLDLENNNIGDAGARALIGLTNLTYLNLRKNKLGPQGARVLARLVNLTALNLSNNRIEDAGASALSVLKNLRSLSLIGGSIGVDGARALLDAWVDAPSAEQLRFLDLQQNGDLSQLLPLEVLDTTDAQAILAAYRRYRTAATQATLRPLNEAKLLVVGNEAVGKTSLIRYLVSDQPRDPNERKTSGTAIHERIETQAWSPQRSAVTLNVWDFGGQEIMHGTHRFFLTERSLYLLVLENRREDDRSVYDWLKTIRNRGGDSPVIVVINKCDEDAVYLRLDETGLSQEYPAIAGFVRTCCDPGGKAAASITRLRELIVRQLVDNQRLKHLRDPIPQPWLRVKEAVAALARRERVLASRDFERLCETPDRADGEAVTDAAEQRALLQLLHDLGVVVAHGLRRDSRAALREITLLDPNWLTGAIYTLLNSRVVRDQGGEFARAQLAQLLDTTLYPPAWHEFILDMMQDPEIGLCFELPGTDHERYLIPEALPANEPDYGIWPEDALRFRFAYDLLPPGLIPRFIVQAHRNLTDKPTRWRTGVVLGAAGCRVLVRGDRDRRRLDISVAGPEGLRRSALNIVLDDLDEVHARNPEIGAKALVPLTDEPELDVGYDHLLRLEQRHDLDHEFDPEDADRPYRVRELLEGVRRDPSSRMAERGEPKHRFAPSRSKPAEPEVAPPPPSSWWSAIASWRFFSIACGLGAALFAVLIWLLPSNEWRAAVGGLVGIALLVTAFMLSMNPARFYRRVLIFVIPAGLLLNGIGFTFDVVAPAGRFYWNGAPSEWFFVAWAVVVGWLVLGDLRQSR